MSIRDISLFFSYDVFDWFWYQGKKMPISENEYGSFPPCSFLKEFVKVQYYFFKYLTEFTTKVAYAWTFLMGVFKIIHLKMV